MNNDTFFANQNETIFTVRLLWSISQPTVFGVLEEVVKYALQPNNGIEGFYEVDRTKLKKVSKKDLKLMLDQRFPELSEQLFKRY